MSLADEPGDRRGLLPRFTLKDGNTFMLADALGDIQGSDDGLFLNDTRLLSRFELGVAGRRPSLLGAAISQDNTQFTAHLTNRPLPALGERAIPKGVIHIERTRFLWESCLYEQLRLTNFSDFDTEVPLKLWFDADFADIFEVQGHVRPQRGVLLRTRVEQAALCLAYRGRDDVVRSTHISFSGLPLSISGTEAAFAMRLPRGGTDAMFVQIGSEPCPLPSRARFDASLEAARASMRERTGRGARISSTGRVFNQWTDKSSADLALLTTALPTGPYPYAGIPWFATQFGRDAIITALQTLWMKPQLAAGVLRFLASTQARTESAFRDSQPGKIMHEMRRGEMASLREVPFGQYYGGVDTTPLFVMLAGAYERSTGDRVVVDEIWENLLAAVGWIEARLESSASGFLDYARGEQTGLANQAWKDSHDSMFHADGAFPRGPLAVVEVQGYAFAAFLAMAELATVRDRVGDSARWLARAERLRADIERHFWIPEMDFYALAIDGDNQPCRVRASNAGHLLFCGVPSAERAASITAQLLSDPFCNGWGIRTLAEGEVRFNPMSYHNGSVWPHDTSLCVAGIARYGGRAQAVRILSDMFEAAHHFSMRLPELYCGFARTPGEGPTPYPVACMPQAWSSGAAFMLLQACLGLQIDGRRKRVDIDHPMLPLGIESLSVLDLPVGDSAIDLEFHSIGAEVVAVPARHQDGGVKVVSHL